MTTTRSIKGTYLSGSVRLLLEQKRGWVRGEVGHRILQQESQALSRENVFF